MFHQRLVSVAVRGLTDGPNIVCGDDGDTVEEIVAVSRVRAPDEGPGCAVPMFNHRAVSGEAVVPCPANRPDVIVSDRGNARERIGLRPQIWASDNFPIGGRDWAGNEQSEQDKSGCASDFHVVVPFYGEHQSLPSSTSPKHHPGKKGLVWISNSFVAFVINPRRLSLPFPVNTSAARLCRRG